MALHVDYEVAKIIAFAELGNRWVSDFVSAPWAKLASESMLEAALVHVRNVVEFLRRVDDHKEFDVVANDYFPGGWNGRASRVFPDEQLHSIHRRVVHLTSERLSVDSEGNFEWANFIVDAIPRALTDVRLFLADLAASSESTRVEWFSKTDERLSVVGI